MPKTRFIAGVVIISVAVAGGLALSSRKSISQLPATTANSGVGSSTDATLFYNYVNSEYHFTLSVPRELELPGCAMRAPVKVSQSGYAIAVGTYFTGCPTLVNPKYFFGWTIYASNNVKNQLDAADFIRQVFGQGCESGGWNTSWQGPGDAREFWIQAVSSADTSMEYVERVCPAELSRTMGMYSPALNTLLVISFGQQPAFPSESGWYDGQVAASMRFVYRNP